MYLRLHQKQSPIATTATPITAHTAAMILILLLLSLVTMEVFVLDGAAEPEIEGEVVGTVCAEVEAPDVMRILKMSF